MAGVGSNIAAISRVSTSPASSSGIFRQSWRTFSWRKKTYPRACSVSCTSQLPSFPPMSKPLISDHESSFTSLPLQYAVLQVQDDQYCAKRIEELQEVTQKALRNASDPTATLKLIDNLQRLGLAYHFEEEINVLLERFSAGAGGHDLFTTALQFRLLRYNGYPTSCEPTQRIRKGRGKNKRNWAIDGPEPMIFNKNGVAIGSRYCKLNRFIADVGRDLPVDIPNWKLMPRPLLQMAWERIADRIAWTQEQEQIKWKVREVAEIKLCVAWKGYKTRLRDQHYKSDKREPSRFNPPCESIDPNQWKKLVELWDSPHYQEIQNTNRDNRHQLDFSHCTGTKPFAVVEEEYRIKHQTSPDRPKLYELTRTKNQDCEHWVDEGSYRHWEEITSELSKEQPESLNTREVRDAAFQKVFGQRDGRSRLDRRHIPHSRGCLDFCI